ncbi:unnamed protein product [Musa textilis]
MVPLPMILPLLLSLKMTYLSSWLVSLENCDEFLVMCFEHPPSRYYLLLLACVGECIYKRGWFLGTNLTLGASKIDLLILSFYIKLFMILLGTHINLYGLTFLNRYL